MNDHWNRSLEVAFASLYIGDSQTMAAEAGVLGVSFVRFRMVDRLSLYLSLRDTEDERVRKEVKGLVIGKW